MGHSKRTWLERVTSFCHAFAAFLMILLTIAVAGEVIARSVFNYPISISSELTKLFFPWLIFFSAIVVTYKNDHLKVSFFLDLLPNRGKRIMVIVNRLIMLFFTGYLIISSIQLIRATVDQQLPLLGISKLWLYVSVTVSFTVILLVLIVQCFRLALNRDSIEQENDDWLE